MLFVSMLMIACGPKKPAEPEKPKEGWNQEPESSVFCYYPPSFSSLSEFDRKEALGAAFDAMISQWKGERQDGISMSGELIESVEIIMLGDMSKVEGVARDNLSYCKQYAANKSAINPWKEWFSGLPSKLRMGECDHHFSYIVPSADVEIDVDWEPTEPAQFRICKDDKIRVRASSADRFQLEEGGPWITVEGNPEVSTAGSTTHPCNTEGCLEGQLILRFKSDTMEEIVPIGTDGTYTAPDSGLIYYGINDDSFYNNKWYMENGVIEHATVRIEPIQ